MKGRQIPYTADELAFIQSVSKWARPEAHAAFCQRFGRDDVTLQNFNALCKRRGWFTGRTGRIEPGNVPFNKGKPHPTRGRGAETQFKAGGLPHNTRHLGYERVSKDGYVEISVAETNPHTGYERRFVHKHRYLWEQVNGPIPDGCALKCLDGNKANTDPDNWEAISRGVLARLNGGRFRKSLPYDQASDELKPMVMAVAKLKHAARERRKTA